MDRGARSSSPNTSPDSSLESSPEGRRSARYVGGLQQHTNPPISLQSFQRTSPSPEYVSPYPPLRPSCTRSVASTATVATTATTSTQVIAGASSATSVVASQVSSPQELGYTSSASPLQTAFQHPFFHNMFDARSTTQAQKQALIAALHEHRINTIGELRRVERIFASLGSPDLTQPMTSAWMHYVNSNSLLSELRGITRNYPFSSECLEEARRRVHQDPDSNRSWNYCWLVLAKVQNDRLIATFARVQASRKEMWGGRTPPAESINQLTEAFIAEWSAALAQLLRYWEQPPTR